MTFCGPKARSRALVAPASVTAPVSKCRFSRPFSCPIDSMTYERDDNDE
jgi:hypothetical protein